MPTQVRVGRTATGGKPEDVRRHNLGTVLGHLHASGAMSRAELTARMGLNRSTIAGLVSQLAELQLVEEGLPTGDRPGVGRPSLVVRPRTDGVQVVAVDIGVDRIVVALVGLGGQVLTRCQQPLSGARSPRQVAEAIRHVAEPVMAGAPGRIVGVGVSLPGVVRHSDGLVRFAPNIGWVDQPLGELLTDLLCSELPGIRVKVGNDADLGVVAEHLRGAAAGHDDVVFIAGEVGVGGGCIIGGRPLLGAGGYAGELGHLPLVPDGRRCRCGARGCWETEIGGPAVARALGLPDASSEELVVAVRAARAARAPEGAHELDGIAHYLGLGLAGLVNLLNPQLIIVGGLLGEVLTATAGTVRAALDAAALTAPAEQVTLVTPALGGDAVLVGASELAWAELLLDPVGLLSVAGGSLQA